MIIENHPTGGTAVLLYDMHGEYSGGLVSLPDVRCEVVWSAGILADVASCITGEYDEAVSQVAASFERLFPGLAERLDVDTETGTLWRIYGSKPETLEPAFDHLAEITNSPPSGDDDVYDYWPSAMRMLRVFAVDLDELVGGDHLGRYRSLLANAGAHMAEMLEEGKLEA